MEEKVIELSFGACYPSMVEGDDEFLLEPGDGLEEFIFPGTERMSPEAMSSWVESNIICEFDGDLDDPSVFKTISFSGIAKFGTNDVNYDEERGLVLSNVAVYLRATPAEEEDLREEALDDLFHAFVLKVNKPPFTMSFTEFEDYDASLLDHLPEDVVQKES